MSEKQISLSRQDYEDGLKKIEKATENGKSYIDGFTVTFPDGLNTASTLEICRVMQDPTLEAKINLMRICVAGKRVEVTCPNGKKDSFCITNPGDSIEGFDLFRTEPLALIAISDAIYGFILKKSVRLSEAPATASATGKASEQPQQ